MTRPAAGAPEPVLFDFRAPPRLPAATTLAIETIHARLATTLRTLLTQRLREVADANPGSVELLQSAAYAERFGPGAVRFHFELGDAGHHHGVLQFGTELAAHCLDRLLGGSVEPAAETRPLTAIERSVLGDLIARILPALGDAAREIVTLAPVGAQFVTVPDAPPLVVPGALVAVLRLEVRCGSITGPIDLALPLSVVTGVTGTATIDPAAPGDAALVEGHLRLARVTITGRIGFRVAAFEIAAMQPGTILATGHPSHGDIEVAANGRRLFTGMLGRHLGHAGVRLLREAIQESQPSRSPRRIPPP